MAPSQYGLRFLSVLYWACIRDARRHATQDDNGAGQPRSANTPCAVQWRAKRSQPTFEEPLVGLSRPRSHHVVALTP